MKQQRERFHHLLSTVGLSLVFVSALFLMPTSHAQLMSPQVLELKCEHLFEIQQRYLNRHVTIQTISAPNLEHRTIDQFIKRLDGSKMYLLQKDVAQIEKTMKNLFKNLRINECSSIEKADKLFVTRVKDRIEYVKKALGPKFKFNPNIKLVLDPEKRKRPANVVELNSFHDKYLQYQVANYMATDMSLEESKQRVIRNYERILRNILEETPERETWAGYLDSFARALDPHSSYLSKDALEDFEIQMRLSLEGIGATLSFQDGFTVIEQLIAGGAAYESGKLKAKDKIIEVSQGEDGETQNVIEMPLRDVVRLIRGKKGTKVKLTILRKEAEGSKRFNVVLVRDKIKLEDEAAQISYFDREVNGAKKKVALLTLPSFYADNRKKGRSASDDMKKLIAEARVQKADAMVLDMSNNGGGSLDDAVKIAGLFFKVGNVVKQSSRDEDRGDLILADRDPEVDWAGPLVVLISRVSASASEIVSGALKDYKRAVIVGGDHTFGKGTVQSVEYLPPGLGAMKTTVGMFFTAGGKSTQHIGVDSDVMMPSAYSTDEIGEKTLDYSLPPKALKPFLSSKAYVAEGNGAWKPVSSDLITRLRKKSQGRLKASEEFKKIEVEMAKAKKRGSVIDVAEVFRDKSAKKEGKGDSTTAAKNANGTVTPPVDGADPAAPMAEEEDESNLTREQRKEKYLKRPDVLEAIDIAVDIVAESSSGASLTIGAKPGKGDEGKKN